MVTEFAVRPPHVDSIPLLPSVWVPLDQFGSAVFERVRPLLAEFPDLEAVAVIADRPTGSDSGWKETIVNAIDRVLASPRLHDQQEIVVPSLWVACDLAGENVASFIKELAGAINQLANRLIRTRVFILARQDTTVDPDSSRSSSGLQSLLDQLIAPGKPGYGVTTVFVVGNRDRANRIYEADEVIAAAGYFLTCAMATGLVAAPVEAVQMLLGQTGADSFGDPSGRTLPVFGSFAVREFLLEQSSPQCQLRQQLLAQLTPALLEPVAQEWTPRSPAVPRIDPQLLTTSAPPPLPRVAVSLWTPVIEERRRTTAVLNRWIEQVSTWEKTERTRLPVKVNQLKHACETQMRAYQEQDEANLDAILQDKGLAGFFAPLERYTIRKIGEIDAALSQQKDHPPTATPSADDPRSAISSDAQHYLQALQHRLNGRFLLFIMLVTCGLILPLPFIMLAGLSAASAESGFGVLRSRWW